MASHDPKSMWRNEENETQYQPLKKQEMCTHLNVMGLLGPYAIVKNKSFYWETQTSSESHTQCHLRNLMSQTEMHYTITMNNILFVSSSHIFSFLHFLNPAVWIMFYSLQILFLISLLLFTFIVGTDYLFFYTTGHTSKALFLCEH